MPQGAGIVVQPLAEAIAKISARTPLGIRLRSDEWEKVPLAIRERAFFSARVESIRLLSEMQGFLKDSLAGISTDGGAVKSRDRFISDMRALAIDLGVGQLGKSEITDLQGPKRLGLIYDMQTRMARGYARWKLDQDPDFLNAFPAQRLIRIYDRKEPRDWIERWDKAAQDIAYEGVAKNGRMIARKDSPIWIRLSRFGTPWPPFDFQSGMGLEDVSRSEAEALDLVDRGTTLVPDGEITFNASLEASVQGITPEMMALAEQIGLTIKRTAIGLIAKPSKKGIKPRKKAASKTTPTAVQAAILEGVKA